MRLGFDLHDGPIQDVLALAADVQLLQQQVYPFILDDYREQAHGRFDDLSARLVELDRQLREIAHSLETKSVISRPLGEILHREVDGFAERTGIRAELEIRGDPDSLSSAQRITVFRAIQEALANVREHASATSVSVRVRARRSAIEVQIVDDGMGFEVERALAKAAQRGRLGLVGIGERVRMVGGTFELESQPGGPTIAQAHAPALGTAHPGLSAVPGRAGNIEQIVLLPRPREGFSPGNDRFRSHACDSLTALAVVSTAVLVSSPVATPSASTQIERKATLEIAVVKAMNPRKGRREGSHPLRAAPSLRTAAEVTRSAMLEHGFFSHDVRRRHGLQQAHRSATTRVAAG